ncbi:MAG TPA: LysR substrate-binding domain-containing protein [Rhodocyclaceae bacterium]|nr:LysR substrate-binding domain-containing protein [Rhodocyclaceae bacterium]
MNNDPLRRLACLAPLQGFEATARHLSVTLAAAELSLTQSAVSRQIQGLEEQLGVALFQRRPRQLALTPAGEAFLESVRKVFAELADTMGRLHAGHRPAVTLTTTVGVAALWLVPRLSRFLADHPDIDVRISANNRVVDIQREGIDLALRYVLPQQRPSRSHYLFGEEIFPVGTTGVLGELAHRPPRPADLADLTLLNYDDPNPDPWLSWSHWLRVLGLPDAKPKAILHFNHYDQLIAAASAGQGIALGRSALLGHLLGNRQLLPVHGCHRHLAERHYYVVEATDEPRPEVRTLRDWLLGQRDEAAGS